MRNCSRVADELYIKRLLFALEDFLCFSLYSFSYIAKQVTTLKIVSTHVVCCSPWNEHRALCLVSRYHIVVINITYAQPRQLRRQSYAPSYSVSPLRNRTGSLCINQSGMSVQILFPQLEPEYCGKYRALLRAVVHPIHTSCYDSSAWDSTAHRCRLSCGALRRA